MSYLDDILFVVSSLFIAETLQLLLLPISCKCHLHKKYIGRQFSRIYLMASVLLPELWNSVPPFGHSLALQTL